MLKSKPLIFTFNYQLLNNERIDKYLAVHLKQHNYSRVFISNLIKEGNVLINNQVITAVKTLLKFGDKITININYDHKNKHTLTATKIDITIIYEDDDIIVINKPNNLVVHPGAGNWDNTLVNSLLYNMKNLSEINQTDMRPGIIHRIDKQTTGLLIVAKNNQSHYFLSEQLKNHNIKRIYIALVHGTINERSGTIDAPIARDKNNRLKMTVNEVNGKSAVTHFQVLETFKKYTLVKCQLETGRTHQIRVHFQWINHPVVNDPLYSKYNLEDKVIGQYLHAQKLTFIHPLTKKKMTFECNLPDFFEKRLQLLRKENEK